MIYYRNQKKSSMELMFADDLALTEESELEVMGVF